MTGSCSPSSATPSCPKPSCPKPSCAKPSCPKPSRAKPSCPKPSCPKPSCAKPSCPQPSCPQPSCPQPSCSPCGYPVSGLGTISSCCGTSGCLTPCCGNSTSTSLAIVSGANVGCINQLPPSEILIRPAPCVMTVPGTAVGASCMGGYSACNCCSSCCKPSGCQSVSVSKVCSSPC